MNALRRVLVLLVAGCGCAAAQHALVLHHHDAAHQLPGTIVVPASDFFDTFPDGDSAIGGAGYGRNAGPAVWYFNSSAMTLGDAADVGTKIPVKEAGTYHLYVRASGTTGSSFRVAVDGKQDATVFGQSALGLQRGGDFTLKAGTVEIKLTGIQPRPTFNVLVLTKKTDFTEADLKPLELPEDVKLWHEYTIQAPNIVKFGDVDGSGKYAIVDILNDYSTIVYANDGHELWRWTAPPTTPGDPRGNEAAGILWDFHHTGRDELAHWRWRMGAPATSSRRCPGRRLRCRTWTTTTAWQWRSSTRTRMGRTLCWCLWIRVG
jgi:hypothetical protein